MINIVQKIKQNIANRQIKIPAWIKNRYVLTLILFLVWLCFIDDYNFIVQYNLCMQREDLSNKTKTKITEINKIKNQIVELKNNEALIEKYAREHYLLKKENETIFIYKKINTYEN